MRLRSLDSGRLFSANTAFRDKPFTRLYPGGFAEPFFAAPARFFTSAQVFAPSRPAKGSAPFDPRQGRGPCTCPASPFTAKPGLCFTCRLAAGKQAIIDFRQKQIAPDTISSVCIVYHGEGRFSRRRPCARARSSSRALEYGRFLWYFIRLVYPHRNIRGPARS